MKKSILFVAIILSSYTGISQTSGKPKVDDDVTCIPNESLRIAAAKIETGKRDSMLLQICEEDKQYWRQRVEVKDKEATELRGIVADQKAIIRTHEEETQNITTQRDLLKEALNFEKAKVKRAKISVRIGIPISFALGAAATYFIIK